MLEAAADDNANGDEEAPACQQQPDVGLGRVQRLERQIGRHPAAWPKGLPVQTSLRRQLLPGASDHAHMPRRAPRSLHRVSTPAMLILCG